MQHSKKILSLFVGTAYLFAGYLFAFQLDYASASDPAIATTSKPSAESNALAEERRQTKALLEKLATYDVSALNGTESEREAELLKQLEIAEKSKRQLQFQQESFVSEILRLKQKIREVESQSPQAEEEAAETREEDLLEQLRMERMRAEKFKRNAGDSKEQFREVQRSERRANNLAGEVERTRLVLNKRNKKVAELEAKINELIQGSASNKELRDSLIKARQAAQRFEVQLEQRKHIDADNKYLRDELAKLKAGKGKSVDTKAKINLFERKIEESNGLLAELRAQKQALEAHLSSQGNQGEELDKLKQKLAILERNLEAKDKVIATTTGLGTNIKALHEEIAQAKKDTEKVHAVKRELQAKVEERDALLDKHRQALSHVKEKIDSHDAVLSLHNAALSEKDEELLSAKRQLSKTIEETRVCSLSKSEKEQELAELPSLKSKLTETSKKLAAANASVKQCASDLDSSGQLLSKLGSLEKNLIAAKNEIMLKETEVALLTSAGGGASEEAKKMLATVRAQQKHMKRASASSSSRARLASTQNEPQAIADVMLIEIVSEKVNFRSGPGEEHSATMQFKRGTRLTVEDRQGDWYRVFSPTGTRGYVRQDLARVIDNGATKAPAVAKAARGPKKPAARAAKSDRNLVAFGEVKIGGRTPTPRDPESRAIQRLRSSLSKQQQAQ